MDTNTKKITPEMVESVIISEEYHVFGDTFTVCVLLLQNGYSVVGKSGCARGSIFDAKEGEKYARESAVREIWPLEGYLLKQQLYEERSVKYNITLKTPF